MAESVFFPWLKHLDQQDLREFFNELAKAASEEAHLTEARPTALDELLRSWKVTASVLASPEAQDLLDALGQGDFGPVEPPTV